MFGRTNFGLPWVIRPSAHSIVTSSVRGTHHDGNGRHSGVTDGIDESGSSLYDTVLFIPLANHEPSDILQKHQGRVPNE